MIDKEGEGCGVGLGKRGGAGVVGFANGVLGVRNVFGMGYGYEYGYGYAYGQDNH